MSLLVVCVIISLCVVTFLLMPFFAGAGGQLDEGAALKDADLIDAQRRMLLVAMLKEEKSFKAGLLTAREWQRREIYFANRFVDLTRRLDFVRAERGM